MALSLKKTTPVWAPIAKAQLPKQLSVDDQIRALQQASRANPAVKRTNAAKITALLANQTAKNSGSMGNASGFSDHATSGVFGVGRSVTGTGQALAGLYDLITPGKGNNRFTKQLNKKAEQFDTEVDTGGFNKVAYKGGQLAGDVVTFSASGVPFAKTTATAMKPVVNLLPKGPSVVSRAARYMAKPQIASDIVADTILSSGNRSARGMDVSPLSVATDFGMSLGLASGIGATGAGFKAGAKFIKNATDNLPAPRRLVPNEAGSVPGDPFATLKKALPEGYRVEADGAVFDPKGVELTTGQIQDLTQPKFLTDFEMAAKKGDEKTMRKIAAEHPGDDRVHIGITDEQTPALQKLTDERFSKKKSLVSNEAGSIQALEPPRPKVGMKNLDIDPDDPFGNRRLLTRIRNEAGSLVDDDAQMISLLKRIEKQTGRKGLVDQWYFDTGNVRASNSIANSKLKNSEDFRESLYGLTKRQARDFDDYAAARAELKNYKGLKTSRGPQETRAIVKAGDAQYGERFAALNRFYKQQAQEMFDAGLIDAKKLKSYLASDDYVRIQRDMEDLVNPQMSKSRARSIGTTTATQKRRGSQRDIISPTGTVPKRTQQLELEIQRNKAASNTIDLLNEAGLARRVKDTTNKNTISRLVNGKREVYEVPGDIKRVMDSVSPYQLGVIARVVSAPARLFRAGTTALSAPFTVTNYLRDQASSALYSKSILATHNPQNIVAGLRSATVDFAGESRNPLWQKFEQFAGDQTIFDELRNVQNTRRLLREIRRGETGKISNMVTSPIRTLEDLNSITEKATRFQNFKGIYQKTLKATGSEDEAIKAAVLAARQNSVDFQRGSSFTRAVNLFIPYFNASVQGSRNVVRAFRDRPMATSMKSVGLIIMPSIAATAYNYSDENRRKAYESINEFEKEDNFIIVGPNARQQEDGSWTGIYKIPKPQGYRELTDPARDMAEAFFKGEPVENVAGMFKDMLGGLTGPVDITDAKKLVGSLTPQAAKPWIQLGMNQDLYTGNDIVPDFMMEETDDPTKRAYKSTSGTARLIADQLNVSPIQVEKAIVDVFGSLGRYGVNASDNVLASQGKIPEEQIGGRSIAQDFSRRLFEASGELLDENKTPGRRYYEDIKTVSQGLNKNELAAFNSVHPSKTNFLGEDIFDENKRITNYTRAGAYLNNPNVFEADRKLDQLQRARGNPGNPLFDLPKPLATKVLLKAALPPGSSDPELSKLYDEPWYQDYNNARSRYYDQIKQRLEAEGKTMPKSANPYPETPAPLQTAMDIYSALPQGTGERSDWIRANPGLWQQMTAQWAQVDAWENKERVAIGLAPIVEEEEQGGFGGFGFSSGGGRGGRGGGGTRSAGSAYKYAVSLNAGGDVANPKVKSQSPGKAPVRKKISGPKVTLKKSQV